MFNLGFLSPRTIIKDFTAGGKYVSAVTGNTTVPCAYRVTLLNSAGTALWTDSWRVTSGTAFSVSLTNNGTYLVQTIRMELRALCARAPSCTATAMTYQVTGSHQAIASQTWGVVGSHQGVISTTQYSIAWGTYMGTNGQNYAWQVMVYVTVPTTGQSYLGDGASHPEYVSSVPVDSYVSSCSRNGSPCYYLIQLLSPTNNAKANSVLTAVLMGSVDDYGWIYTYTTVYDYSWVSSQLSL